MSDGNYVAIECFVYRSDSIRAREIRSSISTLSSLPPRSSVNRASAIVLHLIYVSTLFSRRLQPAHMRYCLSRYNDLPRPPRASSSASATRPVYASAVAVSPVSRARRISLNRARGRRAQVNLTSVDFKLCTWVMCWEQN